MCGIAGFCDFECNFKRDEAFYTKILTDMRKKLAHRGTNEYETYLNHIVGFSQAGCYTLNRNVKDCAYIIAYEGELYNAKELVSDLTHAGFEFHTACDTEILFYAFLHYGPDFVKHLNGIFSFAIWNPTAQKLYLYRDRIGAKPCFYHLQGKRLLFASEPKALFCHPALKPHLNSDGLREILSIGPARTAGNGIFEGVSEVLPGHFLCFSKNGITDNTYWDIFACEHTDNYDQTVEKVSFLLRDAVQRQMISDVPVCSFLSGGLDSSIVTALAYRYLKEQGQTLTTFSFDFKENDKYFQSNSFQPERDLPYVRIMLKQYPTHHFFLECDETALADTLYTATDARDYPGMADIDASLLYFCSLVKQHNGIALTGECADEIFGGYPWFYRPELLNCDGFPWSFDLSARTLFLKDEWIDSLKLSEYAHDCCQTSLAKAPVLAGISKEEQKRRGIAYLNIKWFMQTLLDRMDRAGMYSGLKARVPFADHRIIEYVFNVPWEMKYRNGTEKALLRDAVKDLLPEQLIHRKKSPYPKTYHPGYEQLLIERFYQIIQNPNAPAAPLIDREKALAFLKSPKEYGKPWFGQLMAGPQLIAYFIQLNYWMEKYHLTL